MQWLVYRVDSLQAIHSLKDDKTRVLRYFDNKTNDHLVDPTLDLKWKRVKASCLGLTLSVVDTVVDVSVSRELSFELGSLKSFNGWTKTLNGAPNLSHEYVVSYHNKISSANLIKKKFDRGCQFLEEQYIDIHSVHIKDSDNIFIVKRLSAASLKQVDRCVIFALSKSPCNVYFAPCQCPSGTSGTCSHIFALMKMVKKWVADGFTAVPEAVACTSKPQYWSILQSRGRVTKIPIPELRNRLKLIDTGIPAVNVIPPNQESLPTVATSYGHVPVGSILSNQCCMMPFDCQVFSTVSVAFYGLTVTQVYPPFPLSTNINWAVTSTYIRNLSDKERYFVYSLQIDKQMVDEIEKETVNQATSPTWFHYRKGRLTASMNNQLKMKSQKTVKGLLSAAEALWKGLPKDNKILQM